MMSRKLPEPDPAKAAPKPSAVKWIGLGIVWISLALSLAVQTEIYYDEAWRIVRANWGPGWGEWFREWWSPDGTQPYFLAYIGILRLFAPLGLLIIRLFHMLTIPILILAFYKIQKSERASVLPAAMLLVANAQFGIGTVEIKEHVWLWAFYFLWLARLIPRWNRREGCSDADGWILIGLSLLTPLSTAAWLSITIIDLVMARRDRRRPSRAWLALSFAGVLLFCFLTGWHKVHNSPLFSAFVEEWGPWYGTTSTYHWSTVSIEISGFLGLMWGPRGTRILGLFTWVVLMAGVFPAWRRLSLLHRIFFIQGVLVIAAHLAGNVLAGRMQLYYYMVFLPPFLLALNAAWSLLDRPRLRLMVWGLLIAITAAGWNGRLAGDPYRHGMETALAWIESDGGKHATVLHSSNQSAVPGLAAAPSLNHKFYIRPDLEKWGALIIAPGFPIRVVQRAEDHILDISDTDSVDKIYYIGWGGSERVFTPVLTEAWNTAPDAQIAFPPSVTVSRYVIRKSPANDP